MNEMEVTMPGFPRHNVTPRIARMLRELEGTLPRELTRGAECADAAKAGVPRREKTLPAFTLPAPAGSARHR